MIRVLLQGCMGKMGQCITRLCSLRDDMEIVAGVDIFLPEKSPYPVYSTPAEVTEEADVAMDFTRPEAVDALLPYCLEKRLPLLLATTAITGERLERIQAAALKIPVFMASNLSLGITLLRRLLPEAARTLAGYDVEIIERHHNQKSDAPSGTALTLAKVLETVREDSNPVFGRHGGQAKRRSGEIGIHAVRGGTVAGDHEVSFYGHDEVVTFSHHAASREIFGTGALAAAFFLAGKPAGFYDMDNLLQEVSEKGRAEILPHLGQLVFSGTDEQPAVALPKLPVVDTFFSEGRICLLLPMAKMAETVTTLRAMHPDAQPVITPDLTLLRYRNPGLSPSDLPRLSALTVSLNPRALSISPGQLKLLLKDEYAEMALRLLETL